MPPKASKPSISSRPDIPNPKTVLPPYVIRRVTEATEWPLNSRHDTLMAKLAATHPAQAREIETLGIARMAAYIEKVNKADNEGKSNRLDTVRKDIKAAREALEEVPSIDRREKLQNQGEMIIETAATFFNAQPEYIGTLAAAVPVLNCPQAQTVDQLWGVAESEYRSSFSLISGLHTTYSQLEEKVQNLIQDSNRLNTGYAGLRGDLDLIEHAVCTRPPPSLCRCGHCTATACGSQDRERAAAR
jgi:hypothetical protein